MSAIMASFHMLKKSNEAKERAKLKAAEKGKKSRKSAYSASQQSFNPTPPISSARTAVWHWILDGIPTTVMLNKETSEVWCNGVVLDTLDGFTEDESESGGVVDFCIYIEETGSTHKARVKRAVVPDSRYGIGYDLYVDGYQIDEHLGDGQQYQEQYTEQYQPPDQGYAEGYDQAAYTTESGYGQYEGYDQNGYGTSQYDYDQGAVALPNYDETLSEAPPCYDEAVADEKKTK